MIAKKWKPVRRGHHREIYCSPACGHGCTHETYLQAKEKGRKLCKRLGKGWEPRIWENMGWHYAARLKLPDGSAHFQIYEHGRTNYWADLTLAGQQFTATMTTPAKARDAAVEKASLQLKTLGRDLESVLNLLLPPMLADLRKLFLTLVE